MLIRYTTGKNGKAIPQAKIYTAQEHGIKPSSIDYDAVRIARRLRRHGFQSYIVGGAVRDLLLGRSPKDFDMATNASPAQIRKLFRNSRVIGKRFRLVHIFFQDKIIEVATFRALESEGFHTVYGSIEEDAARRDFTLNSLYYDTENNQVLDFNTGFEDIRSGIVKPVIHLKRIFHEDPVRMIRAVKYSVRCNFKLTFRLKRNLLRSSDLLASTPNSRMTEEVFKILQSGNAAEILRTCFEYRLLVHMLPFLDAQLRDKTTAYYDNFFKSMSRLDEVIEQLPSESRSIAIAYLTSEYFYNITELGKKRKIPSGDVYTALKTFLKPVTPPNRDVESAVHMLIKGRKQYVENGFFTVPSAGEQTEAQRPRRTRKRRRSSGRKPAGGQNTG